LIFKGLSNSYILGFRIESSVDLSQLMSGELLLNTGKVFLADLLKEN